MTSSLHHFHDIAKMSNAHDVNNHKMFFFSVLSHTAGERIRRKMNKETVLVKLRLGNGVLKWLNYASFTFHVMM